MRLLRVRLIDPQFRQGDCKKVILHPIENMAFTEDNQLMEGFLKAIPHK